MIPPKSWLICTLQDVCHKIVDGSHNPPAHIEGGVPMLSARNVENGEINFDQSRSVGKEASRVEDRRTKIQTGSVLLTIVGSLGRSAVVREEHGPFLVQRSICVLHPAPVILSAYLKKLFDCRISQSWFEENSRGTAQKGVYLSTLATFPISLPPLAEQGRIVAKLNALSAYLIRARAELRRVPKLAANIRASILASAYRGELISPHSVRYDACERWISSTFYGPRFGKEDYVDEGIPTVRTTDFRSDGTVLFQDAPRVTCGGSDFEKWCLRDGDLLVTRTGSIGKCAVYSAHHGPALPSAYLIRVRLNQEVLPIFAWMMFASPQGQRHLGKSSRAVTQPNINASAIRSLAVPILTLEQQRTTVQIVEKQLDRADRLEAEAARAVALLDRLEASILAKAFRGELVPQDPADEPASALLDRIRTERVATPKAKRGRHAAAAGP